MNRNQTGAGANANVGENLLEQSGLPLFFEVADTSALWSSEPENRHGQSVRIWARSLTVMQKEAIVLSARSGRAWRLASDEGPYLDGHDYAPCPLSFMTTGMVSAYANEILAAARQRNVELRHLELVQQNHYAMEGSALRGTMTGSAMPVDLEVRVDCDLDDDALAELLDTAVRASPLHGLLSEKLSSLFTLNRNSDIAFCFMTQLGRYAKILKWDLDAYDVIQDTHFPLGGCSGGGSEDLGDPGKTDPVETHVYLTTDEGDDFARQCLDMGEQTCFVHALCRTPLTTNVSITRRD